MLAVPDTGIIAHRGAPKDMYRNGPAEPGLQDRPTMDHGADFRPRSHCKPNAGRTALLPAIGPPRPEPVDMPWVQRWFSSAHSLDMSSIRSGLHR